MKIERISEYKLRCTLNNGVVQDHFGGEESMDIVERGLRQIKDSYEGKPTLAVNVPREALQPPEQESLPLPTLNFGINQLQVGVPLPGGPPATLPLPHLDYGAYDQPAAAALASHGYPSYLGAAGAPVGNKQQVSLPLPHLDFGAADRPAAPASYASHARPPVGNKQQETLPLPVLNFGPDNGPAGPARATGGGGTAEAQSTQPSLPLPPSVFA